MVPAGASEPHVDDQPGTCKVLFPEGLVVALVALTISINISGEINMSRFESAKYQHRFGKYHLAKESIATATCAMHPVTELHKRALIFTIHLRNRSDHHRICESIYRHAEIFCEKSGIKKRSLSYTGLASFIDVNGSKFTGADRDSSKVHCHGVIFLPHSLNHELTEILIQNLHGTFISTSKSGKFLQQRSDAVEIKNFDFGAGKKSVLNWIGYAQKEVTRIDSKEEIGIFLPFDLRNSFSQQVRARIEAKQHYILTELRGPSAFKIYRD